MVMERKEELLRNGIDLDKALRHMMGSESLLQKFIAKFLQDDTFPKLFAAIDANDRENARLYAHSLKAITASLGLVELNRLVVAQEGHFKIGEWDEGLVYTDDIKKEYKNICMLLS